MIKVTTDEIRRDVNVLLRNEGGASHMYGSLLRILISPSSFHVEEDGIKEIVDAIRKSEANSSYSEVIKALSAISPMAKD